MPRLSALLFAFALCLPATVAATATPQVDEHATAPLRAVHADGATHLTEAQVAGLAGLRAEQQVSRKDLQAAADRLVQTGLFSAVKYNFNTDAAGVTVTFHLQESERLPVLFDNIPWFTASQFAEAIRTELPFYDGTLPAAGSVVDAAADAVRKLLASQKMDVSIEHQVTGNPLGEGSVQEFQMQGANVRIARLDFSDAAIGASPAFQQHLSEITGKPFSRMTIDLFLAEQVRPIYLQQGYLRVKLGPPEVRLSGNPDVKLPDEVPVFIPVNKGDVYRWSGARWNGNVLLSPYTLDRDVGLKPGDVADGMAIEGGWDRVREEYGHRGYLGAQVDPAPKYDDQAHTISYDVNIKEGNSYRFGTFVLTGISQAAERVIRQSFPIQPGETFDKIAFEHYLTKLEVHHEQVFGELPIHYETVGHWLRTDATTGTVDVLLDFK